MGMYDRDWYREDYRRRNGSQASTSKPTAPVLGAGFAPGLVIGLMIGPVITLCILASLGYRL